MNLFTNKQLIFFISFLLFFPVVLLNQYFLDDNYRIILGYYRWSSDYRLLADWLYYVIGFSFEVVDTFPFNYILQFFILGFFIYRLSIRIKNNFKINEELTNYISLTVFLIFFNPYFLQNIYFRFDSIIMVLSVLVVLSIFFLKNKRYDFLSIIIVLFLYQPSIIGYPVIVCLNLLYLILKQAERKLIYTYLFSRVSIFISACFLFFVFSKFFIEPNNYSSGHFKFIGSLKSFKENLLLSVNNLKFSNYFIEYSFIFSSIIFFIIFLFWCFHKNKNINLIEKVVIGILILFVLSISVLNVNVFLYTPRLYSRTYIGFGFFLFFIFFSNLIMISHFGKRVEIIKYKNVIKVSLVTLFYLFINISFVNFNYFKNKMDENRKILNFIEYDLSTLNKKYYKNVAIGGFLTESLRDKNLIDRYPVVKFNFLNQMDVDRHRFFYVNIKDIGYDFNSDGFYEKEIRLKYNKFINLKPTIIRKDYDILKIENELYIYLKNNGVKNELKINKNRLD